MIKLLKWVVALVVLLVVAVVLVGLFLPKQYHVERSVTIDAPPEVVFKYLNDLEEWEHWEPWTAGDPSVAVTLGDQTTGVGANQSWTSESGKGTLEFTMADPDKGIAYDLEFEGFDPSTSEMTYEVVDGKTVVTWTMDGEINTPVIGGYFVMMMDSMVGPMYENGLRNLKNVAEVDSVDTEAEPE